MYARYPVLEDYRCPGQPLLIHVHFELFTCKSAEASIASLSLVSKRTSVVMCNVDIPSNTHHIAGIYNPTSYLSRAQMGNYRSDIRSLCFSTTTWLYHASAQWPCTVHEAVSYHVITWSHCFSPVNSMCKATARRPLLSNKLRPWCTRAQPTAQWTSPPGNCIV